MDALPEAMGNGNARNRYRQLLLEAKPHRSKYYDPTRPGQGELYEALERVLLDIKAFTPHSIPFLHRVSKKDVPDYHLVIRHPMDLSTMHKKLRAREYGSKADFVGDLNLIYDNCMTYNTAEDSPLRTAVRLLRERWTLGLAKVPDIVIHMLPTGSDFDKAIDHQDDDDEDLDDEHHLDIVIPSPLSDTSTPMADQQLPDHSSGSLVMARHGGLMRSFRRSQIVPSTAGGTELLELADWAFFCNAFPDTWSVDAKSPSPSSLHLPSHPSLEFNQVALEEAQECIRLHWPDVDAPALGLQIPRLETQWMVHQATLRAIALIFACFGVDCMSSSFSHLTPYIIHL